MYADNTLTPKEAIRLCALGTLNLQPMAYSDLANSIRHFVSRILGPSLDVMGASLELLKYEGLVTTTDSDTDADAEILSITDKGAQEFRKLMLANVRTAAAELNKLVIALKFRFLHSLPVEDQLLQTDLMIDFWENEISRLTNLNNHHSGDEGHLGEWLTHDIELLEKRLTWLHEFSTKVASP